MSEIAQEIPVSDKSLAKQINEQLLAYSQAKDSNQDVFVGQIVDAILNLIQTIKQDQQKDSESSEGGSELSDADEVLINSIIDFFYKNFEIVYLEQIEAINMLLEQVSDHSEQLSLYRQALTRYVKLIPSVYYNRLDRVPGFSLEGNDLDTKTSATDVVLANSIVRVATKKGLARQNTVGELKARVYDTMRELKVTDFWGSTQLNMSHLGMTQVLNVRKLLAFAGEISPTTANQLGFAMFNNITTAFFSSPAYISTIGEKFKEDTVRQQALWSSVESGAADVYELRGDNASITKYADRVQKLIARGDLSVTIMPGNFSSRRAYFKDGTIYLRQIENFTVVNLWQLTIQRRDKMPLFTFDVTIKLANGFWQLADFRVYPNDEAICHILFGARQLAPRPAWVDLHVKNQSGEPTVAKLQSVLRETSNDDFSDAEWLKLFYSAAASIDLYETARVDNTWQEQIDLQIKEEINNIRLQFADKKYLTAKRLILEFMQSIFKAVSTRLKLSDHQSVISVILILCVKSRRSILVENHLIKQFIDQASCFVQVVCDIDSPAYVEDDQEREQYQLFQQLVCDVLFFNESVSEQLLTADMSRELVLQDVFNEANPDLAAFNEMFMNDDQQSLRAFMAFYRQDSGQSRQQTFRFLFNDHGDFVSDYDQQDPIKLFDQFTQQGSVVECLAIVRTVLISLAEKQVDQKEHHRLHPKRVAEAQRGKLFVRLLVTWFAKAFGLVVDADLTEKKLKQHTKVQIVAKSQLDSLMPQVLRRLEWLIRLQQPEFFQQRGQAYEHAAMMIRLAIFKEYQRLSHKEKIVLEFAIAAQIIKAQSAQDFIAVLDQFDRANQLSEAKGRSQRSRALGEVVNGLRPRFFMHLAGQEEFIAGLEPQALAEIIQQNITEMETIQIGRHGIKVCSDLLISSGKTILVLVNILRQKLNDAAVQHQTITTLISLLWQVIYEKSEQFLQEYVYFHLAAVITPLALRLFAVYRDMPQLPESYHHVAMLIDMSLANYGRYAVAGHVSVEVRVPLEFDPRSVRKEMTTPIQRNYWFALNELFLEAKSYLPDASQCCVLTKVIINGMFDLMHDPQNFLQIRQLVAFSNIVAHINKFLYISDVVYIKKQLQSLNKSKIISVFSKNILLRITSEVDQYLQNIKQLFEELKNQHPNIFAGVSPFEEYLSKIHYIKPEHFVHHPAYLLFFTLVLQENASVVRAEYNTEFVQTDIVWMQQADQDYLQTRLEQLNEHCTQHDEQLDDRQNKALKKQVEQLRKTLSYLATLFHEQVGDVKLCQFKLLSTEMSNADRYQICCALVNGKDALLIEVDTLLSTLATKFTKSSQHSWPSFYWRATEASDNAATTAPLPGSKTTK